MKQPVRISCLVPTTGRPTLQRALDSAAWADEVLVDRNNDGDLGYAARHRLMARAKGTHLCFLDCDDVHTDIAEAVFRERACDRPVIAQMKYGVSGDGSGYVLWHQKILRHGMVGTPMFCVPNDPDRLGTWRPHAGPGSGAGDYAFISETCGFYEQPPIWVEQVVALIRPSE